MNRIESLNALIEQFDLNQHPFYQDWRAGTLPMAKMQRYATEYGRFVALIDRGWETLGEAHYAAEEREHSELWQRFQASIQADSSGPIAQTEVLVGAARQLFGQAPEAAGALYAFEAQQPNTSRSKLDGLGEHYAHADRKYFEVHADDFAEAESLRQRFAEMSDDDFNRTHSACAVLCASMWSALDGVYYSA